MSGGLGGMGAGPSDELLGILYDNNSFQDVETKKGTEDNSDYNRMLEYGKTHKKKGFIKRLFHS